MQPDKYDPVPDLALLLDAALRAGWSALPYVGRLTEGLGLRPSAGAAGAERLLREALGLQPAVCAYCEDDPDHPYPDNPGTCTCSSPGCGRGWCPHRDDYAGQDPRAEGAYRVEGKDGFDPEADYYPLGEHPDYGTALRAARDRLAELNQSQPGAGGQDGIQDRVYVVHPNGRRERVFS